ncbi:MAG: hypothetical protein K2Q22_14010 [Cytophagales bacterium]|nr:hypothetical protein [Cytophagales bacterium]
MVLETIDIGLLKTKLKEVVWDYDVSESQLLDVFLGKSQVKGMDSKNLRTKVLNSYNWYFLIDMLGIENAKVLLDNEIVNGLFPRVLREKYFHASRILSR